MDYKFDKGKYVTNGIYESLPLEIQLLLWDMIATMQVRKKDYLQVFNFKIIDKKNNLVELTHSQEQPKYSKKTKIKLELEEAIKVYCIDDVSHATMLFAEEY